MKDFYYDFHIHSSLSPCGDSDSTPNNIAGMASIMGLDIIALTDHNTSKNCPAFFEACERYGVVAVAGMELTTSEDIHVVCLFEHLSDALKFDAFVSEGRLKIKNRPEIFGEQPILDGMDEKIGEEEYLLTASSGISVSEVCEIVSGFGGIAYPAHIDREANGIIAVLGTLPLNEGFKLFELNDREKADRYSTEYSINKDSFLIGSDAHCLTSMREGECTITLDCDGLDADRTREKLFKFLKGD